MPVESAKESGKERPPITELQWRLPVSLDENGNMVSLRDYATGGHATIPFSALSDVQRAAVAATRIEMFPGYEMASLSDGAISKDRAVKEVRAGTKLGRQLAEIEYYIILKLLDETKQSEVGKNG